MSFPIIIASIAIVIFFFKLIRLLLSKIFEIKYESYLKAGSFLKATLWGRLYYNCLSAGDKRGEGITNINAAVDQDIRRNFFSPQTKTRKFNPMIAGAKL